MSADNEQYRAGFEAWAREEGYELRRDSGGFYFHGHAAHAWRVWTASKREASTEPSSTSTSQGEADSNSPEFDGIRKSGAAAPGDALDARRYRQLFSIKDFCRDPLWPVVDWMRNEIDVDKEDIDEALDADFAAIATSTAQEKKS